jgi:hypothetical protein
VMAPAVRGARRGSSQPTHRCAVLAVVTTAQGCVPAAVLYSAGLCACCGALMGWRAGLGRGAVAGGGNCEVASCQHQSVSVELAPRNAGESAVARAV